MAVPKKKMSRSRSRRRKAAWRLATPATVRCAQCNARKQPHRVCHECGTYRGREILTAE